MALQLILGSSGAGKSHYIYHKIIEESLAHAEREYLVIVPEQFTMQTQKELVRIHPGRGILNIDVLSFQRLAYRVFEETGGDDRTLLEETGKTLVLQKVVQMNRGKLKYLGSHVGKPGYIRELKSLISELMQYDIRREEMDEMLEKSDGKALLHQKMQDVQVLYTEFRSYLQERFLTGEEVLDVLCEKLSLSEKIKNSTVVFDGFTGFTPLQYKVIEQMLRLCPQIAVTVTLDEREDPFGRLRPYELFAMSRQMVQTLCRLAQSAGTAVEEPEWVRPGSHSRFAANPALHFMEQSLFRYNSGVYEEEPRQLQIFEAANPLREMEEVARQIARMVRTEGYRYGDIAVITGDPETYGNYAKQVFERASLPFFLDRKHSVLLNPFVEFLRSALAVMTENFSYASVFRHLRCGLADLSDDEIDRLENYVIALGIRGWNRWRETWVRVCRGMPPEDLLEINALRERAANGLLALADAFKRRGNTVEDDTLALYRYIVDCDVQRKLDGQRRKFSAQKEYALEKEYAQIYGIVMNLLDKLVELLGDEKITQGEYVQLVEAGLSEASVGIIPPSSDQILVGDMERTRLKEIRALFFVGVNDGIIPKSGQGGGILSESDREFFLEQGISLAPTPREAMYMQRFYLYLNLTKPDGHLVLSYSQTNASGAVLSPAYLTGMLQKLYPALKIEEAGGTGAVTDCLERPQDGLAYLISGIRECTDAEPEEEWKQLYSWFASREEYRGFLKRIAEAAFCRKPADQISRSVAKALYGEISPHSATRLERFASCAFAHFLRYGLRLSERAEYEFTPMDMGNVVHGALEYFSSAMKERQLTWKDMTEELRGPLVEECLEKVVHDYGNTILHSSARNEYMIERVRRILNRTVWALHRQMLYGEFLPEGVEVSVEGGRIDRMDVLETEKKVYVKVIDYKTGNTTFDLLGIFYGLQLQLMVYMDGALQLERRRHPDKEVEPAGVFYYRVSDPMVKAVWDADGEKIDELLLRSLRMSGLAAANRETLEKMDRTLESLPVSVNRDGSLSQRSSVATKEQFEVLGGYVNGVIRRLIERIEAGDVQIDPFQLERRDSCMYCPYRPVCGFDQRIPGFSYRRLKKLPADQIWSEMGKEVEKWQ